MKMVRPKRVGISTRGFTLRLARHINLMMEFVKRPFSRASSFSVERGSMLAKIANMIGANGLQVDVVRLDLGQGGLGKDAVGDVLYREIDDLVNELMFRYSPEATRATTSRRVISGSTMASRPLRP